MDFRSEIGLCEDEIDYIKNLVIKKMKAVIEIVIYSIKCKKLKSQSNRH